MRIRQCSPESYGSNKSPEVISFLRGVTEMRIYCRVKFEPCFVTPLRATCTKLKIIIFAVSIYLDESNSRLESSANMFNLPPIELSETRIGNRFIFKGLLFISILLILTINSLLIFKFKKCTISSF